MGATPLTKSSQGSTPLFSAIQEKNTALVNILLNAGADGKELNEHLYTACLLNNADDVKYLLTLGADPDARLENDRSISQLTALESYQDIASLLQEARLSSER